MPDPISDRFPVAAEEVGPRPLTPSPDPGHPGGRAVPARIRPMTRADLPAVLAIEQDSFGTAAWSADQWREEVDLADDRRRYVVLETIEGECLGFAGVWDVGGDADVLTIAVAAGHRGQGWGSALLQHLIEVAHSLRCRAVFLEVAEGNTTARALYASLGFSELHRRRHYYGPDRHAVTMQRVLRLPAGSIPLDQR